MTTQVVTYGDFAALATAQGWTAQFLAEQFRGKIEAPSEFFHRVLDPRNAGAAIPFRSVLDFYVQKLGALAPGSKAEELRVWMRETRFRS